MSDNITTKKTYTTPTLTDEGTFTDLTLDGTIGSPDGLGGDSPS